MAVDEMIYLDLAGSGIVRESVAQAYVDYCHRYSLNPHGGTKQAEVCRRAVEQAGRRVLACLGIPEGQASVIWTSGGTEALNLGIRGVKTRQNLTLVVDAKAHPAMTESARARVRQTGEELRWVRNGHWSEALAGPAPKLVCVCHVNNETGEVADLQGVRRLAGRDGILLVDGAQSFGKVEIDWEKAGIDLLAVSSRKIGGPSAVGALVVRRGVQLQPVVFGGGQQGGIRSGTVDTIGAVMFADAAEEAFGERIEQERTLKDLSELLWAGLSEQFGHKMVRLSPEQAYPGIASFAFPGYEGAVLKRLLAECHDIVIGTGSACSAESGETSHVLADMGVDERTARGALRVSFNGHTTRQDIETFLNCLKQVVEDY